VVVWNTQAGTVDYEVLANIPQVRRVIFSGANDRELPNNNLLVCEDFILRDNVSVTNLSSQQLTIQRDLIKSDDGTINFGSSTIRMNGNVSAQRISGDFTGGEALYNLIVDNPNGLSVLNASPDAANGVFSEVNGDLEIRNQLTLTNGLVTTDVDNSLTIRLNAAITNGSNNAHVDGPLIRQIDNDPSGSYNFPVGKSGRYALMAVENPTTSTGVKNWNVEYFSTSPPNPLSITSGNIQKVSENEYWSVSDGLLTSGQTQANIRLRWDGDSEVSPTGDISDLAVAYYDGSGWLEAPTTNAPSGNVFNGTVAGGPVPFSSRFITLGTVDQTNTPLPITLTEFTARLNGDQVILEWTTASEINNDRFEIERTFDGLLYEVIGKVKGAGTTTQEQHYSFIDEMPLNGINYYRLRQIDYDGAYDYSPIRAVQFERNGFINTDARSVKLYPNPNTGELLFIDLVNWNENTEIQIALIDVAGIKYFEQRLNVNENGEFSGKLNMPTNLAPGLYFIQLISGNKLETYKLLIK